LHQPALKFLVDDPLIALGARQGSGPSTIVGELSGGEPCQTNQIGPDDGGMELLLV